MNDFVPAALMPFARVGSLLAKDYEGLEKNRALSRSEVEFRFAEPFPALLHRLDVSAAETQSR